MSNDVQLSIRLPKALVKGLAKLEDVLAANEDMAAFRVSRQSVLRLALLRGLDALEKEHAVQDKR